MRSVRSASASARRGFVCVSSVLSLTCLPGCHCGGAGSCAEGPAPKVALSGLKTRAQLGDSLCWAASAEALTDGNLQQCVSAAYRFPNATHCCANPLNANVPADCDGVAWPRLATNGYSYSVLSTSWPSWDMLAQLKPKQGVAVTEQYACNNEAHMMTIIGTATVGNRQFAEFYDPAGHGDYLWRLYTPVLLDEPQYFQSRAYYNVVKSATHVCTPDDGIAAACDESVYTPDARKAHPAQLTPTLLTSKDQLAAKSAATCGMSLVREIGSAHPASLGFVSADEAAKAVLSEDDSVQVAYLHTAAVNTCTSPETNCPTCQLFFYQINGVSRGALTVGLVDGTWQVVKMGEDWSAPQIAQLRHSNHSGTTFRTLLIVPEIGMRLFQVGSDNFMPLGTTVHNSKQAYMLPELQTILKTDNPTF